MPRSGLPGGLRERLTGGLASMRPGQSCPGVVGAAGARGSSRAMASMRPGQSCPGVAGSRSSGGSGNLSFNEAGAIMPRSGKAFRGQT